MLGKIKHAVRGFVDQHRSQVVPVNWIMRNEDSWLSQHLGDSSIKFRRSAYSPRIEKLAEQTNQLGPQPLWSGYEGLNIAGPTRTPDKVRTAAVMGNLYTYIVQKLQPQIVVEFGTAFGVSGMYFLAGIEANNRGQLLTFEPNDVWRKLAILNLPQISNRFNSTAGTFEDNINNVLPQGQTIDLAFIDAIHTKEFVVSQLDIVLARASDKAIIILDDIRFSDSMRECWQEVSRDSRFSCSAELGNRVGIVELDGGSRGLQTQSDDGVTPAYLVAA